MSARILLVEDDPGLGSVLQEYLSEEGLDVMLEGRGDLAVPRILGEKPDLVVLDLMLPGIDGFEVQRRIRPDYTGVVIVLTARRGDNDQVALFEMGADDFVTKPVDPRVLFARIKAHLRRQATPEGPTRPTGHRIGSLTVDRALRRANWASQIVPLTSLEFDLLWMLAEHAGSVVERDLMYTEVMGTRYDGLDRGVDSHISRIRRKLRAAGMEEDAITSVRGVGYQLTVSA